MILYLCEMEEGFKSYLQCAEALHSLQHLYMLIQEIMVLYYKGVYKSRIWAIALLYCCRCLHLPPDH